MELANLWSEGNQNIDRVRVATRSDAAAIQKLLQTAVYSHLHVDWYLPGDWIGDPGFVVVPKQEDEKLTSRLFGARPSLRACLAASPDPAPAAWIRVAAIGNEEPAEPILKAMVELAAQNLKKAGVNGISRSNLWLTVLGTTFSLILVPS